MNQNTRQQLNQYYTNYYTIIGPNNETKKQLKNQLTQATQVSPNQWGLAEAELSDVLLEASKSSSDHCIIYRFYQGIGNPVNEWVFYNGEKFQLSRFVEKEPNMSDIEDALKQQKIQQLQQQKQKAKQQLDQIDQQLQEWMGDEDGNQ